MKLYQALNLGQRATVALVGGGGKTSIMYHLAEEIPAPYRVLITTTTKIAAPEPGRYPCFYTDREGYEEALIKVLQSGQRPVLASQRIKKNNKFDGVKPSDLAALFKTGQVDFILVEADGSKGRPLKGHLDYEPVIPEITTRLIIVIGADVLGRPLDAEYVHRPEIAAELTGQEMGTIVKPETIARLIAHPRGILRTSPAQAKNIAVINKIDSLGTWDEVYETARLLKESKRLSKIILCSMHSENPVADIIE
jgi:probable selenium-dependent hydroxylase accessory protein YqeC